MTGRQITRRSAQVGLGAALLLAAAPLRGQDAGPPEGWHVRSDHGGHGDGSGMSFTSMPPGWHITTGPACIMYDPTNAATGPYQAEMEVFLFDPDGRREGYGIIIGGSDLDGDGQTYTYFLIRQDGRFLLKRREGAETRTLRGWEEHPAIVTWAEREEGSETARNVLTVRAGETVSFLINGTEVASLSRAEAAPDGIVGFRVNHALNLHVSKLEIEGIEPGA